ncbi:hypothetical protein OBBRIDRAFT_787556 [Obba rivulosa]|uniref:Uncharacterized protein n=1 Tax=Obba rivulosa TaxID=1052685 RepID=A0A8E2DUM3_9APHY|nr:hypothetical protein OBBRIDRAFT_787556 [Obba rivulosa]
MAQFSTQIYPTSAPILFLQWVFAWAACTLDTAIIDTSHLEGLSDSNYQNIPRRTCQTRVDIIQWIGFSTDALTP